MFDIFSQIQGLIKKAGTSIDNNVFSLHYKFTVYLILACGIIIGSNKYFGDPIDCTAIDGSQARIVDNFCWFNSYIIVPSKVGAPYFPGDHPAVRSLTSLRDITDHKDYKPHYLRSYQWIEFILFIQAAFFFLPRYLWRHCWEQGRIKSLTEKSSRVSLKEDNNKGKNAEVVGYLMHNRFDHFEYAVKYVACEVLNFLNVLAQFLILNKILGMTAKDLWNDLVTSESNHDWNSMIARVFPNLARCDVLTPATGGNNYISQLCVLPINIFATKIYIILWFHFLVLTVLSASSLIYRGVTILSPTVRTILLQRQGKNLTDNCLRAVKNLSFGDWFILYLVGKNMDPFSFKSLVTEYNDKLVASRPSFIIASNQNLVTADFAMRNKDVDKTAKK